MDVFLQNVRKTPLVYYTSRNVSFSTAVFRAIPLDTSIHRVRLDARHPTADSDTFLINLTFPLARPRTEGLYCVIQLDGGLKS